MNYSNYEIIESPKIRIENFLPRMGIEQVKKELMIGMRRKQKSISSKYFYNKAGVSLFEEITQLSEYYLARTEKLILSNLLSNVKINFLNCNVIELGNGNYSKIKILFDQISPEILSTITYTPVDINQACIESSSNRLLERFPMLLIHGITADFTHQLHLLPKKGRRIFCFFGSTVGNMNEGDMHLFMQRIGAQMLPGDQLLLGLDLIKDQKTLEKAYNDNQGLTERFNKNILYNINYLTGSNFNPDLFEHLAFYNEEQKRIEMHLKAIEKMEVTVPGSHKNISIAKGETIHTENSYKYDSTSIIKLGAHANLMVSNIFTDPNEWFSLVHYTKNVIH